MKTSSKVADHMDNLGDVLDSLKNSGVKARQEALSKIRDVFAQDRIVANFHIDPTGNAKPQAWLAVFQALFSAVLSERDAFVKKKSTSAAQKRLANAASTVRWLTERTAHLMNNRVVKALFDHLLHTMVYKGELLLPVALDYIKALRCIVGFVPHLDQIDDVVWITIVERGFNVVLGDPIKTNLEDDATNRTSAPEADDSNLFSDDHISEDENDADLAPPTSRKRARSNSGTGLRTPSHQSTSHPKPSRKLASVSLEQVEFMSLLSVLLRSSSSPILSPHYPYLVPSILRRLRRLLYLYTADTSLFHDYVIILSSTLPHLSLNRVYDVRQFACTSWDGLIGLWGTKNKRIKEGLVVILHVLFPFITSENHAYRGSSSFDCADGIIRLSSLLNDEADNRWGVSGLLLDSLRLELAASHIDRRPEPHAFVAKTFRSGWNFDAGQALAWAILELHADCIGKLFQLSEAIHIPSSPAKEGKRIRLENPVTSLLALIQRNSSPAVRSYHLQILLFVVDHHWLILHDALQQEVIQALLRYVSLDDSTVQSWALLCLAAVAYAESLRYWPSSPDKQDRTINGATWDSIWTSAIRRANVPIVCRAACHTAYTLLFHTHAQKLGPSRIPLSSQRVLLEIETLAKDLDVQGPPYPYDSVCSFLALSLKVASQDMRLYRMRLEEKVLTWLVDCWKVVETYKKVFSLHMANDLLFLLESICGLTRRSDLIFRIPLPECQISGILVNEAETQVIRDFLLDARLPKFNSLDEKPIADSPPSKEAGGEPEASKIPNEMQLAQPRVRERRITAFLLKSLEHLVSKWEERVGHPSAEAARQSLDMAVIALSFESVLVLNGTQSNRRLVQCACKLIGIVTAVLLDSPWTPAEKALISLGLDPLTRTERGYSSEVPWDAMLLPDTGSGIKVQHLSRLTSREESRESDNLKILRTMLLRILWQNADVQSAFSDVANILRSVLQNQLGSKIGHPAMDEKDGFGPIRTATLQPFSEPNETIEGIHSYRFTFDVCITFLTVGYSLQSVSGEPTRDKGLIELVLDCAESQPEMFLLVLPVILENVRQRTLELTVKNLDAFLVKLSGLLRLYAYARSKRLQSLVTQFLDSTLDIWTSSELTVGDETLLKIQEICTWLAGALRKNKIRAWSVRDALGRFFARYLVKDPTESTWSDDHSITEELPSALLPMMGADEDIRVRFRVAVINARLFAVARHVQRDPVEIYNTIKESYTVDIDNYEYMLTRMLSLGNVMVKSSAVRRGPYWHLLETCIHSPIYCTHIESILQAVSQRLGLVKLSVLFESYASQLAFSIRKAQSDILRFPPHLLGYRDRMECAEATFRLFTPTNVWNSGQKLFEGHCKVISKSVSDGIRECFGDIVGYQVVAWIDQRDKRLDDLEPTLREVTFQGEDFKECLRQNVDGIVTSILRTLGDQDYSDDGPIVKACQDIDQTGHIVKSFRSLTRYRKMEDSDTHGPNLPAFPTETILRSLQWLRSQVSNVDDKATTYHVLHQLFADVEQSPLVNEQNRLINAISLWIALHYQDFEELTLLYALIHGATTLLGQADLARSSQSMLDWSFSYYRRIRTKHSRIPDILVRICCLAHDYALSTLDERVTSMGNELLQWIDAQALELSKIAAFAGQVKRALPAWPHQPSPQLAQLYESITSESLSSVIGDPHIASSKFRIVRRLRDHAVAKDYDSNNFATSDFWRLKECMPPVEQLQDADIDAFADLLYLSKGRLDSFRFEPPNSTSILGLYKKMPRDTINDKRNDEKRNDDGLAQEAIVLTLLAKLQGDSASKSYAAYLTLRLIKSVSTEATAKVNISPLDHQAELRYLETYHRSPRPPSDRDLCEQLAKEPYLELTRDFTQWIAQITTLFTDVLSANDPFYAQLTPILQSDSEFAVQVLPVLVHTLLRIEKLDTEIKDKPHRALLSNYFTSILSVGFASISCLRSVIDVVLHLRNYPIRKSPIPPDKTPRDELSYNKWLDIDFMLLAQSAITCGAYTTALLFLELAADNPSKIIPSNTSPEQILYEIYRHIDELDGFYGIRDEDLHQNLMKRFHHEKQWERAFHFHGAALEAGHTQSGHAEGLVQSFHSLGFDHLANDALRSTTFRGEITEVSDTSYRLAWRTETWDLPDSNEQSIEASLYLALRAIHRERDGRVVNDTVWRGLRKGMERLRGLGSENFAEIREVVQSLMCLHEVAKWRCDPIRYCLTVREITVGHWESFVDIDSGFDFSDLENVMATRISLVRSARRKEERQQIGTLIAPFTQALVDIEKKCLIRLSRAARAEDQVQIALNSVVRAQRLEAVPSFAVYEEFASVLWCQKEEKSAVEYLDGLRLDGRQKHIHDTITDVQRALLLARLGAWSSQASLKKPNDIQQDYFKAAADILLNDDTSDMAAVQISQAAVYHECAIFAERQYQTIVKSPDAVRWKIYVDRKQQELQVRSQDLLRHQHDSKSKEYRSLENVYNNAKKLLEEDSELYRTHNVARDTFLQQAIDMYSRCLHASDSFDGDAAIRLCSLWFANFEDDETRLQEDVRTALDRIPSRKFVFLAHQLSARISKPSTGHLPKCQDNLQKLVLRMCYEHPFHSLYQVYCLQPNQSAISSKRQSGHIPTSPAQTERSEAARELFDRLRSHEKSGERVRDVEHLCDACMQWAKYPIKGEPKYDSKISSGFDLPNDAAIGKILRLQVPVMTHRTPLDASMLYDNCVWIERYDSKFTTAGGVNLPKINNCIGSDGLKYKQLFKGEGDDDLRQDAVMEQVFELVNSVLLRDRETRRRLLSVRDYKVIPLGSRAGLLEFVGNTSPLRNWLANAHFRYHPEDLHYSAACKEVARIQAKHKRDLDGLVKAFDALKERFRPVMRHYFTEKHKTPISWFAMRLNYTRSVATTSIVGHILGLGDRHTSNILLDNLSGQVVHIDLGISFDQGKLLPVPELVPFRMTRDIIDGMGMSGTSGVFQRCAEKTLQVLRRDSEVIMTVLEVFKHDPLHSWTASDVKIKRVQREVSSTTTNLNRFGTGIGIDMSSGTAEEAADRALSAVARKLDKALSVQYTVNQLIRDATDSRNLAQIYYGWAALS